MIVFLGDTAAYFAGKYYGKRKLASAISPKKTLEGAAASIAMSVIAACLWLQIYPDSFDRIFALKVILFRTPFELPCSNGGSL